MKKLLICFLFLLCLTGCSTKPWEYTPEDKTQASILFNNTLNVKPLQDIRKKGSDFQASALLAWIPIVPYSKVRVIDTPDNATNLLEMDIEPELTQSLVEELQNANVFKKVITTDNSPQNSFMLTGNIKKFRLKKYWSFYGFAPLGVALWYLGLPAEKIYKDVIIDFTLTNNHNNIVFHKEYSAQDTYLMGLYYTGDDSEFEPLVKEIYLNLIKDLKILSLKN